MWLSEIVRQLFRLFRQFPQSRYDGDCVPANCVETRRSFAGNKARLNFNLKDYSTKADVLAAVDRINYLGRNTNTTGGLKVARLEVFDSAYEERDVDKIIVLITDGVPTYDADKLEDEVAAVKREDIRIIGLGVTSMVSRKSFCVELITRWTLLSHAVKCAHLKT